jgi:hypothetical protein
MIDRYNLQSLKFVFVSKLRPNLEQTIKNLELSLPHVSQTATINAGVAAAANSAANNGGNSAASNAANSLNQSGVGAGGTGAVQNPALANSHIHPTYAHPYDANFIEAYPKRLPRRAWRVTYLKSPFK